MEDWLMGPDEILENVDEFSLYCHYLGFDPELRVKYQSPIRNRENPDNSPSFSMFENRFPAINREYAWKDSGDKGRSGDIFRLVQYLFGYETLQRAIYKVREDFIIKDGKQALETRVPIPKEPAHIRIKSRLFTTADLAFWARFGIFPEQLVKYRVNSLKFYWIYDNQPAPRFVNSRELAFSYAIYDKYQLYFPDEIREFRFRHDMTEIYVPGMQQLQYDKPTLIITKSYKDTMLLSRFGNQLHYEVCNCRSENTPIPASILDVLSARYHQIITFFDNDGKHRRDFYPQATRHLEVPIATGEKDPTDFYKRYGEDEFVILLTDLLC